MHCVEVCPNHAHRNENGIHIFDADKCIGCLRCVKDCSWGALASVSRTMTVEDVVKEFYETQKRRRTKQIFRLFCSPSFCVYIIRPADGL